MKMVSARFLVLSFSLLAVSSALEELTTGWIQGDVQDDHVSVPYPTKGSLPRFSSYIIKSTVTSTGRQYTLYMGLLQDGLPKAFSLELPVGGCCHRNKTSDTSMLHDCTYATNAGFFSLKDGCCVGNLVTNGKTIQTSPSNRVNFGLLSDSYLIGYLSGDSLQSKKFNQLISGAGWLVRNGTPYINTSKDYEGLSDVFVTEKAPRTSVGVAKNGSLYLMQVDGEEDTKSGLDLYEFAEVLAQQQLLEAVNLDGGGSSVSVKDGKVISRPTCIDTSFICEREVTSITCIHDT